MERVNTDIASQVHGPAIAELGRSTACPIKRPFNDSKASMPLLGEFGGQIPDWAGQARFGPIRVREPNDS